MEKESLLEKDIVETATTESTRKDTSMAAWMDKKNTAHKGHWSRHFVQQLTEIVDSSL